MLKGLFKDASPIVQLLLLVCLIVAGIIAGQVAGMAVVLIKYGFSMETMQTILMDMASYPSVLREIQFFASLGTFICPAIILAYVFSDNYKDYLKIDLPVSFSLSFWTILSMIVVMPFLNFIAYYNQQISFPEALKSLEEILRTQEEINAGASEAMLRAENLWALVLNIVVIGIFAAVGEEFIFRGVTQNIFSRIIRNKHIVIWTAAIIFSLAHFQFFGFVPRMLLGAYFGYLIYFTNNMWLPVIAHFTNNFLVIISFWIYRDDPETLSKIDTISIGSSWWIALISLVLFALIFNIIRKQSRSQNLSS